MGKRIALALLCATTWVAGDASADDNHVELHPAPFGTKGQWVISDLYGGSALQTNAYSEVASSDPPFFGLRLHPGIDYFVARHLSIGADALFGYDVRRIAYGALEAYGFSFYESHTLILGGGLHLAYDFPITSWLSVYPRASFAVEYERIAAAVGSPTSAIVAQQIANSPASEDTGFTLDLFVPVLFHPQGSFFVGVGPDVSTTQTPPHGTTTTAQSSSVQFGGNLIVGGTFGRGRDTPEAPQPLPPARYPHRFGEAGDLAIGADFSLNVSNVQNSGPPVFLEQSNWSRSLLISPSADYFVTDHLSVGAQAILTNNETSDLHEVTTYGGGARLGYNQNINWWLSVYPRISLTVAHSDRQDIVPEHRNVLTATGSLPLLFHVTQHLFVGIGPNFSWNQVDANVEYGAQALVGGWIHLRKDKPAEARGASH